MKMKKKMISKKPQGLTNQPNAQKASKDNKCQINQQEKRCQLDDKKEMKSQQAMIGGGALEWNSEVNGSFPKLFLAKRCKVTFHER